MAIEEVEGLVMSKRRHRDRDFLVKLFTDRFGKLMFFVRGSKKANANLNQSIQPFTSGTYVINYQKEGLSFIQSSKHIRFQAEIFQDIEKNAYATYIQALVDAGIEDKHPHPRLFHQFRQAIHLIDEGFDPAIIANIMEVKCLRLFGVNPEWRGCPICGQIEGPFDYSMKYDGLLCQDHYHLDKRRLHANPRAIHLIRQFSVVNLERLNSIKVSEENKAEIRRILDLLYEEYVGIHLKPKKFIDDMASWEDKIKWQPPTKNND